LRDVAEKFFLRVEARRREGRPGGAHPGSILEAFRVRADPIMDGDDIAFG